VMEEFKLEPQDSGKTDAQTGKQKLGAG